MIVSPIEGPEATVWYEIQPPQIHIEIAGRPSGKGRPRFDSRSGRAYTDDATNRAENDLRAVWRESGEPRMPDDAALAIAITLIVQRPAGHFRKDGTLSAEGRRHPVPRNKKPDLDNAVKLVMDALNGRAYRDDVQVALLHAVRVWGDRPQTEVALSVFGPAVRP